MESCTIKFKEIWQNCLIFVLLLCKVIQLLHFKNISVSPKVWRNVNGHFLQASSIQDLLWGCLIFNNLCACVFVYSGMDRYRYFIFNQRSMLILGLFQIACATVCVISGLIDGVVRKESALSKSKIPIWAGVVSYIFYLFFQNLLRTYCYFQGSCCFLFHIQANKT